MKSQLALLAVSLGAAALYASWQREGTPQIKATQVPTSTPIAAATKPSPLPCQCNQFPGSSRSLRLTFHRAGEAYRPPAQAHGLIPIGPSGEPSFWLVRFNTSDKPIAAAGSGRGGELRVYRHLDEGHEELVETLSLPFIEDGGRWTCPPGGVLSQNGFSWPNGLRAVAGDYVARTDEVQLKFRLPES